MRVLSPDELVQRPTAQDEAARQYARAIARHFRDAERLLRWNQVDAADRIAKGAAILRIEAHSELRAD